MTLPIDPIHGRGASLNPPNRFDRLHYELEAIDGESDLERPSPATQLLVDTSRTIIAYNDSPDVGFAASINPYRGCEHGCIYCYARPYHEYLGFSAGLDFETRILVKPHAPELLRRELQSPRWQPQTLGVSGVTDAYQPIERRLRLTRRCLEVLAEFRNPVGIVTKNALVTRDLDVLAELAHDSAAVVFVSLTTLDGDLYQKMEPRASHPTARLGAIRACAEAGVPVGVMVAPIIPGLNDHEIQGLVEAAAEAGARFAACTLLRLPHGLGELFTRWLEQHFPDRKEKVLGRIRDTHGGKLNDPRFGTRMKGEGEMAEVIRRLFGLACRRAGFTRSPRLSTAHFRRPGPAQGLLFS